LLGVVGAVWEDFHSTSPHQGHGISRSSRCSRQVGHIPE
jgi:hypothetical protein